MSVARRQLLEGELDCVSGGTLYWDPEKGGMYTLRCSHTKQSFAGVNPAAMLAIINFSADVPDTAAGEEQIINFAREQGFI